MSEEDVPPQVLGYLARHETLTVATASLAGMPHSPTQVDAGEVVVNQGAPADEFFIIVDGEVEVVRDDGAGPRTVATLRSGQFFGEVAILREMPRSATVRAVLPTTLLIMAQEDFRGLVAQSLTTTQDFHQVIQERLDVLARG